MWSIQVILFEINIHNNLFERWNVKTILWRCYVLLTDFLAIFNKTTVFFFRYEWQTFPGRLWSSFPLPSSGYTQTFWTRPEISPWGYPGICQSGWPFGVCKPEGRYGMSTLRYNWMAWGTFAMGHRWWWKVNIYKKLVNIVC